MKKAKPLHKKSARKILGAALTKNDLLDARLDGTGCETR